MLSSVDMGLGVGWQANAQPGEVLYDGARDEIYFIAEKTDGIVPVDKPYLHLIRVFPAAGSLSMQVTAIPRFCSTGANYTCPKLLVAR